MGSTTMRQLLQAKPAVKPKTTSSKRSRPRLQGSNNKNNDGHRNDSSSHSSSQDATTTVTFCGIRRTACNDNLRTNSRTGQIRRRRRRLPFVVLIVVLLSVIVTELVLDIAFNDTIGSLKAKQSSSWSWQDYLTAKTAVFRLRQYYLGNTKSSNGSNAEEDIQQQFDDHKNPFRRIAVMGQFNYGGLPPSSLLTWHNNMLQHGKFAKIAIRGDFPSPDSTTDATNSNETNVVSMLRSEPYNIDIERSNVTTPLFLPRRPTVKTEGLFAPYQNLAACMKRLYQSQKQQQSQPQPLSQSNEDGNDNKIDGVLYLHDDALPNLPLLRKVFQKTHNQVIIGTDWGKTGPRNIQMDGSYQNPRRRKRGPSSSSRRRDDGTDEENDPQKSEPPTTTTSTTTTTSWERRMELVSYRIYPYGQSSSNNTTVQNTITYTNAFGNISYGDTINNINPTLVSWNVRTAPYCDGGIRTFVKDPDARRYLEYDGDVKDGGVAVADLSSLTDSDQQLQDYYLTIPSHTQADFLYIPLRYTDIVVDLSRLMARHQIWIECAFPIIVDQISRLTVAQEAHATAEQTGGEKVERNSENPVKSLAIPDGDNDDHIEDLIALAVPLCTNWARFRNRPVDMVRKCDQEWIRDLTNGVIPSYYEHLFDDQDEEDDARKTNTTDPQQAFLSVSALKHPMAVYHPIKIGSNTTVWEQLMKSINGKSE